MVKCKNDTTDTNPTPATKKSKTTKRKNNTNARQESLPLVASSSTIAITGASQKKLRFEQKNQGLTQQEILDKYIKIWYNPDRAKASKTYQHFKEPTLIKFKGKQMHAFFCKTNPSIVLHCAPYEDSTGYFTNHINKCSPEKKGNIADFAARSTYTPASFRYKIAIWIAHKHCPFQIVQDEELLEIFKSLYSRVDVPHPQTVSRDIQDIYNLTKPFVTKMLEDYMGKVSHATVTSGGKWKSSRWSLYGIFCLSVFFKALEEFKVSKKILALAGDNVENNSTMVDKLVDILPSFGGQKTRSAITVANDEDEELLDNEEDDEDDEVDPDREAWDKEQVDSVALVAEYEADFEVEEQDILDGKAAILKSSKLCQKSDHNGDFCLDLKKWAVNNKLASTHSLVKPVSTRWNTTSEMLSSTTNLCGAIEDVCDQRVWNSKKQRLHSLIPTEAEWMILEQLEPILKIRSL
ncbi:hypothetical protein VKT23_011341 [Stygiomarasmius scandens]|uniref:Uncharacterized protein n=1 Tax=Marasmiellus scandens TaxID=2682957 RepID=A0ABR1JDA7_9AGAR